MSEEHPDISEKQLGGIDFGGSLEQSVFNLEKVQQRRVINEVKPPPGLSLGDFPVRRVTRFNKRPMGIKLTNSYSALQCCEDEDCDDRGVKHGGREELHEREINSVEKSYVEGEWAKVEVTADSGASDC